MSAASVRCVLCKIAEENDVTGALATKEDVTAHQNCLLFASGTYCRNTPDFDDLFGFSVEDVKREEQRGRRLRCSHCDHRGATAGCEIKRCNRSFHYPCAVKAGVHAEEDLRFGTFKLYCHQHIPQRSASVSQHSSSGGEQCCETECAPIGFDGEDRMEQFSPDQQNSRSTTGCVTGSTLLHFSTQACLSDGDETDIESEVDSHIPLPIISDVVTVITGCGTGVHNNVFGLSHSPSSLAIRSSAPEESSLASSSAACNGAYAGPSVHCPPSSGQAHPTDLGGTAVDLPKTTSLQEPPAAPQDPDSACQPGCGDAEDFWKACNLAGCTQTIFTEVTNDLMRLSDSIQSDRATEHDYVMALSLIQSTGKLKEILSQLGKEFEEEQRRLENRRSALMKARSILQKRDNTY